MLRSVAHSRPIYLQTTLDTSEIHAKALATLASQLAHDVVTLACDVIAIWCQLRDKHLLVICCSPVAEELTNYCRVVDERLAGFLQTVY